MADEKKVKVRALETISAGAGNSYEPGEEFELDETTAEALLKRSWGEAPIELVVAKKKKADK
jgi:hypothetical protein